MSSKPIRPAASAERRAVLRRASAPGRRRPTTWGSRRGRPRGRRRRAQAPPARVTPRRCRGDSQATPSGAGLTRASVAPPAVAGHQRDRRHRPHNLGRAPWPARRSRPPPGGRRADYLLLELDRATGRRGRRGPVAEDHLVALTGAEDALVTNNNAAALALAVGLAGRGGVVVSRGELVEIGGGVRIPEIVRRAGARLIEVGTTNRTRAADFEEPLAGGRARLVLRVHPSNFAMTGFTETPDPVAVAELAHRARRDRRRRPGLGRAPRHGAFGLAARADAGRAPGRRADLVTFSGDKLVGGPQAGSRRRSGRPDRPDAARPAGAGDAPGQGRRWPGSPRPSGCTGPGVAPRPRSRSGG